MPRFPDLAHSEMHMANAQSIRRAGIFSLRGYLAQNVVDIERVGGDPQIVAGPLPRLRRRSQ